MDNSSAFQDIFKQLQLILADYADEMVIAKNEPNEFHLNTYLIMKNKSPMFFGSTKINKNYVSYHLMPVYIFPEFLNDISPELKRRMQGKSCFNFKTPDKTLFLALSSLTALGYQKYQAANYL